MDPIQTSTWTQKTQQGRPVESLRARALDAKLPELTADEETMILREFDSQTASARYDQHGDASTADIIRGQQVDRRV